MLDNARYGETGSQRSHTGLTTDLAAVAAACGWTATATARDMDEVAALAPRLRREALFAVIRIAAEEEPRHLPPRDGAHLADRFRRALGVADRLIRRLIRTICIGLYRRLDPIAADHDFHAGDCAPFRRQCEVRARHDRVFMSEAGSGKASKWDCAMQHKG